MSESARSFSKGWIVVGGGHFEFYWEKKCCQGMEQSG